MSNCFDVETRKTYCLALTLFGRSVRGRKAMKSILTLYFKSDLIWKHTSAYVAEETLNKTSARVQLMSLHSTRDMFWQSPPKTTVRSTSVVFRGLGVSVRWISQISSEVVRLQACMSRKDVHASPSCSSKPLFPEALDQTVVPRKTI